MAIDEVMKRLQVGWVVDICATCGRQAVWPFCQHRSLNDRWTVAVPVKATDAGRARLLDEARKRP